MSDEDKDNQDFIRELKDFLENPSPKNEDKEAHTCNPDDYAKNQADFPNVENFFALKPLAIIRDAMKVIDTGSVAPLSSRPWLKSLQYSKHFAYSISKEADVVKVAWEAFLLRLKDVTNDNPWYQITLKHIDEYKDDPTEAPDLAEEYFWKNGWGGQEDAIIKNMARYYTPINVNGAFRIKHDSPTGDVEFLSRQDLLGLFEARRIWITATTKTGTAEREVSIAQAFLKSNKNPPYMGLTFNPDPNWKKNATILNLWQGWPIKPVKGDVQIFLDYAYDIIANRDDRTHTWGTAWCAQIFQEPHIVKGTAIVHRGAEGIGKSFFAQTLGALMGRYYVTITDLDQVFGQFNAHIEHALLTHFEEAFWAGDRRAEGRIKDHISGTQRPINQKNLPIRNVRVYPRSIFDTNSRWVVPASMEARRFGIFDVSEARQRDVDYFAKLDAWRQNGGLAALMYHFLYDVDITKVDLRNPPRTLALMENQIATLRGVKRFWFDVLRSAKLPYFEEKNDNFHVLVDDLYHYWLAWCRTVNHKNLISIESFGIQFKELIPALDVNGKVQRGRNGAIVNLVERGRQSTGDRDYFHKIPALDICRSLWDNSWDALYSWEPSDKWEKLNLPEWIHGKRSIMSSDGPF
jgi:hypothetical protein